MTAENARTPIRCRFWAAPEDRRPREGSAARLVCIDRHRTWTRGECFVSPHSHPSAPTLAPNTKRDTIPSDQCRNEENGTHPSQDRAQFAPQCCDASTQRDANHRKVARIVFPIFYGGISYRTVGISMIINESILLPSVSVPSRPEHLRALRVAARKVVAHRNPTRDTLADLVLAVDAAASTLLSHAQPSSHITCIFDLDALGSLHVHLSTTTSRPIVMHTTSQTWVVLQSLVDDVVLEHLPPTAPSEYWTAIIVAKKLLSAAT